MHKQVITYEDFDGNSQTEEFYFNIARAKIIDMALTGEAAELFESIQTAAKTGDGAAIITLVRTLIELSYGEKQPDGKTFRQNEELSSDFLQSQPFDAMFYEFTLDPPKAIDFIEAIFPAQLMADAIEKAREQGKTLEELGREAFPAFKRPEPQDRLPKREIKDITIVDAQLTDTPLPGHEFQTPAEKPVTNTSPALERVRARQQWEQSTLFKFDHYNPQSGSLTDAGFDAEQLDFLRRNGLV